MSQPVETLPPSTLNFRKNLNIMLMALERGVIIKLKSAHRIAFSRGLPGFVVVKTDIWNTLNLQLSDNNLTMVDSDVVWLALIDHAKNMTEAEAVQLILLPLDSKKEDSV